MTEHPVVQTQPTAVQLSQFGKTAFAVLVLCGAAGVWLLDTPRLALISFAAALVLLGLTVWWLPAVRWAYLPLQVLARPLAALVSGALLALIYYGVITPIGWCRRSAWAIGRRGSATRRSYWQARKTLVRVTSYA